jgi:magnesium transporter
MGESFVLTIGQREVPFLERFISGKESVVTTQKTKLFIQFMATLTSAFDMELTGMRRAVYRDRTRVRDIKGRDIQRLVSDEHHLNDIIAAVVPTNAWLQQLTTGNFIQLYNEDVALMEDLMIANSQLIDSAKSILKTIQNIRNATEAILTQKLNNTIQTLTALTIILTIPTIVASLYGMNVPLPLAGHPYSFWLVLVFIVTVVALVAHFFRQKRWF